MMPPGTFFLYSNKHFENFSFKKGERVSKSGKKVHLFKSAVMTVMKVIKQKEYFSICKCFCHLCVFGVNYFTSPVTERELHMWVMFCLF